MANLDTLLDDIYGLVNNLNGTQDITESFEPHLETFMVNMGEAVRHWSKIQDQNNKARLRMSNIGRPDRQLYFDMHSDNTTTGVEHPSVQIRFLYGHILEQLVLLLVKAAGHSVANEQGEVEVDGIKGSMDCVIDGEVIDVKSASDFAFKKFTEGKLAEDDPFGYLAQLAGYEADHGTHEGGFLVINKSTGALCLYRPDYLDKPNIHTRIERCKELETLDNPPELCYPTVSKGEAGNETINRLCKFCKHKTECHKDSNDGKGLRLFRYSNGIEHFTTVVKEPKVEEVL